MQRATILFIGKEWREYDVADQGKTIDYIPLGFSMNYLQNMEKRTVCLYSLLPRI